jgi:SPP1 family predicted phage head-tail adaptor
MSGSKLRNRVELQVLNTIADGRGGSEGTWVKLTDAWCAIEPLKGRREFQNQQLQNNYPYKISFRSRVTIRLTAKYRVVFGSRIFVVQSFINRNERDFYYECEAVEMEGNPAASPLPDSTVILKNTDDDTLSTTQVAANSTETIIAPDATVTITDDQEPPNVLVQESVASGREQVFQLNVIIE